MPESSATTPRSLHLADSPPLASKAGAEIGSRAVAGTGAASQDTSVSQRDEVKEETSSTKETETGNDQAARSSVLESDEADPKLTESPVPEPEPTTDVEPETDAMMSVLERLTEEGDGLGRNDVEHGVITKPSMPSLEPDEDALSPEGAEETVSPSPATEHAKAVAISADPEAGRQAAAERRLEQETEIAALFDPPEPAQVEAAVLELRQTAGLTAGNVVALTENHYDLAESGAAIGFSITIDDLGRAVISPGTYPATIDATALEEPTIIGDGVLDVGTARFVVCSRVGARNAADWHDKQRESEQAEPTIIVPEDLPAPSKPSDKRSRGRRRKPNRSQSTVDVRTWEFVEHVRETRSFVADQRRFLHPDPSELARRVAQSAPILRSRSSGHPLFAQASTLMADMPWLPLFDDIHAIPEAVGLELRPLLVLPSVPIPADLLMGPLGIVGEPAAAMACARHLMISLYGQSTQDFRLHIATTRDRADTWAWAKRIAPERPLAVGRRFSVVVVDGMENYDQAGFEHADAIEHRVGVIALARSVDELPSYCGTVLQLEASGRGAVLTDHEGQLIAGTPIGISGELAADLAANLMNTVSN